VCLRSSRLKLRRLLAKYGDDEKTSNVEIVNSTLSGIASAENAVAEEEAAEIAGEGVEEMTEIGTLIVAVEGG
jgi:hypothetical protein